MRHLTFECFLIWSKFLASHMSIIPIRPFHSMLCQFIAVLFPFFIRASQITGALPLLPLLNFIKLAAERTSVHLTTRWWVINLFVCCKLVFIYSQKFSNNQHPSNALKVPSSQHILTLSRFGFFHWVTIFDHKCW